MPAGFTPRRAPVGAGKRVRPRLVEVTQRLLLNGLRPAGKPPLRSSGSSQLRGLGVEAQRRSLPSPPHQALFESEVPHIPGMSALLGQEHFLCSAWIQAEPQGPQRSAGLRHPCRDQTPKGVVSPSPAISMSTWCSPPRIGRDVFDTEMVNAREQVMAQVCTDFDATLAQFNGAQDHVHLLAASNPPKVALSHLAAPYPTSHPGGCGRTWSPGSTRLRRAAGSGLRHPSPDHAVARHCPQSRTTSPTRNDQTRQGLLPARKDGALTPDHR